MSGNEIHTGCLSLSRLDFLGSRDLILIRFDLGGGCAAGFVCDEPDFRLTDDNMRRVRRTDVTYAPSLPWSNSIFQRVVHDFLRGSVNAGSLHFIVPLQKYPKTHPTIWLRTMNDGLKQKFDAVTVAVLRQALNEVVTDRRFLVRRAVTALEVAEHILEQAASGERDLNRLKSSAFERLSTTA